MTVIFSRGTRVRCRIRNISVICTNSHRVTHICFSYSILRMHDDGSGMVSLDRDYFEKVKVCEKCGGGRTISCLVFFPAAGRS